MKENLYYFYTYTKSLRKSNSKISPLTDDNNKVIDRPVSDILQDQYTSVWSHPLDKYKVKNPEEFFRTGVDSEPSEILYKVRFTREKVLKTIEELNKKAAPGPDRIDDNILFNLREILTGPLAKIFQKTMDEGIYLWKLQYVIPVLKPGKNKSKAESSHLISLTSQIGKLMERMVFLKKPDRVCLNFQCTIKELLML